MLRESSVYYPDGVVDIGIVVVSPFKNPYRRERLISYQTCYYRGSMLPYPSQQFSTHPM